MSLTKKSAYCFTADMQLFDCPTVGENGCYPRTSQSFEVWCCGMKNTIDFRMYGQWFLPVLEEVKPSHPCQHSSISFF
jgi:hypothetical protein